MGDATAVIPPTSSRTADRKSRKLSILRATAHSTRKQASPPGVRCYQSGAGLPVPNGQTRA
eukprot:14460408-Alexandrium_andersonii.AAC.1